MKGIIHKNTKLLQAIEGFDILVIDEAQDMNLLFFQLIKKFLKDYNKVDVDAFKLRYANHKAYLSEHYEYYVERADYYFSLLLYYMYFIDRFTF